MDSQEVKQRLDLARLAKTTAQAHKLALDVDAASARSKARGKPGQVATQTELAEWLGVHRNTLIAWLRQGFPGKDESSGCYSVPAGIAWMVEQARGESGAGEESEEAKKWLAEYRKEKAREAKRRNDVEEGILVTTESIKALHLEAGAVFRRQAERLERKLGRGVGAKIQEMVAAVVVAWESFFDGLGGSSPEET